MVSVGQRSLATRGATTVRSGRAKSRNKVFFVLSNLVIFGAFLNVYAEEGQAVRLPLSALQSLPPFHLTCVGGPSVNNQSCIFGNVCFQRQPTNVSPHNQVLNVFLQGTDKPEHVALLQEHLQQTLDAVYANVNCSLGMAAGSHVSTNNFEVDHATSLLWRPWGDLQQFFGHVMIDELFPMVAVLLQHFRDTASIPRKLQLLVTPKSLVAGQNTDYTQELHPKLHRLAKTWIAPTVELLSRKLSHLPSGKSGICFRHLILGDLGYAAAGHVLSTQSHDKWKRYSGRLTFLGNPSNPFTNTNFWAFRQHAFSVAGVVEVLHPPPDKPLVLLNDKRHGPEPQLDRRMIVDVDNVAADLSAAYPDVDFLAVRFRDMSLPDQMRLLARANVLITTQGSSSFRHVFLPPNATCIMLGSPTEEKQFLFRAFHELDSLFSRLSYVNFERYVVQLNSTDYVDVHDRTKRLGAWVPEDANMARASRLYNSDVRVNVTRLRPYLDRALRARPPHHHQTDQGAR